MHANGPHVASPAPSHPAPGEQRGYYAQHDFDGPATLSTTLVHALSNVTGADVTEAERSLAEHADPRALDLLFRPRPDGTVREPGRVTFTVWGHRVTVESDGHISIVPPRQGSPGQRA